MAYNQQTRVKKARRVRTQAFYPCPPPTASELDNYESDDSDDEFIDYNAVSEMCSIFKHATHKISTYFHSLLCFKSMLFFSNKIIFYGSGKSKIFYLRNLPIKTYFRLKLLNVVSLL